MSDSRPGIDLVVQSRPRNPMLPFNSQTFVSRTPVRLAAEASRFASSQLDTNQSIPFLRLYPAGDSRPDTPPRLAEAVRHPPRHNDPLVPSMPTWKTPWVLL